MQIIALTGGGCSGKSSVIKRLEQEYSDRVLVIPEAATTLLAGGFTKAGQLLGYSRHWNDQFQPVQVELQLRLETAYRAAAHKHRFPLIVVDRGLLDGAAYWADGVQAFCHNLLGMEPETVYRRYTKVIHMESLATSRPHLYGTTGNEERYEPLNVAAERELALRRIWGGHPAWTFIPGQPNAEQKTRRALDEIIAVLDAPQTGYALTC